MMQAAARIDLGAGVEARMVWQQGVDHASGVPCGAILIHGACQLYVAWADDGWLYSDGQPTCTLVSLVPLSITPGICCPTCGRVGVVEAGRWIEVSGT